MNNNSSIGKRYKMVEVKGETFSWKKFFAGLFAFDRVNFSKDIVGLFNIRKIIIYALIIGAIFGWGWYTGKVNQNLVIDLGEYKESFIKLVDDTILHIDESGNVTVEDKDGNILKRLKAKDLEGLRKQLRPFGFELSPILIAGGSVGASGEVAGEFGAGVRWFRAWKINIESFLTNKGCYPIGASYQLSGIGLKNSSIGIGIGTSWKRFMDEKKLIAYFSIKF